MTAQLLEIGNRPFTLERAARREVGGVRSNAELKDEGDAKEEERRRKKKKQKEEIRKGKGKGEGRRFSEAIWEMHPDLCLGSRQTQLGNLE